jgi:hypothetical protein
MSKSVYVKLGEKAESFSCPSTGLTVLPNQIVKLEKNHLSSTKIKDAIKGTHLERADEDEYNTFINGATNDEEDEDEALHTESSLKKLTKDPLLELAITFLGKEGHEEDEESLGKMKKEELIDFILEVQENEEDEEEE